MTHRAVSVEDLFWVEAESDEEAVEQARQQLRNEIGTVEMRVVDVDESEEAD